MSLKYTKVEQSEVEDEEVSNNHNNRYQQMDTGALSTTYSSQQLINNSTNDVQSTPEMADSTEENLHNYHQRDITQPTLFSSIPKKHIFTVVVLCFINLINYMDRFTIAGKCFFFFTQKNGCVCVCVSTCVCLSFYDFRIFLIRSLCLQTTLSLEATKKSPRIFN